jgi:hypothetical protein
MRLAADGRRRILITDAAGNQKGRVSDPAIVKLVAGARLTFGSTPADCAPRNTSLRI